LSINDVLFVPGLTKNLIFASQLEDKGYVVTFQEGNVFIHSRGTSTILSKVLGVRNKNLYKLQFEPTCELVRNSYSF